MYSSSYIVIGFFFFFLRHSSAKSLEFVLCLVIFSGLCSTNLAAPESTPMWKDFGSTVCKGKQPGENTLKRELWTRFDAVSTSNELHFNVSLFQETEGKGFLDRLEEVSFEAETGLESKSSL